MATGAASRALLAFLVLVVLAVSASDDFAPSPEEQQDILNIKNNCSFSVAPVTTPNGSFVFSGLDHSRKRTSPKPGSPPLDFTPYQFMGYEYLENIALPHGWSGRIWARTDCSTDGNGKFTCTMGDCGSGSLVCDGGAGPTPAATVAELALGGNGGTDSYDISLADGYNLPTLVAPYDTSHGGECAPARCVVDLSACPADQQVKASDGRVLACKPSGNSGSSNIACTTANSSSSSCAVVTNSYTVTFCPDNSEFDPKNPTSTRN